MAEKTYVTVGGPNAHVLLEFPGAGDFLYLGSILTLSYQVYRNKTPVFNCGDPVVDGFAIGNKYVAGTIITTMFVKDEITDFLRLINKEGAYSGIENQSLKRMHTYMKDDATSFNIHVIFTSEYTGDLSRIIIYDATFINNGQVMSINDLITEQTASFVARDVREQHSLNQNFKNINSKQYVTKASDLLG